MENQEFRTQILDPDRNFELRLEKTPKSGKICHNFLDMNGFIFYTGI